MATRTPVAAENGNAALSGSNWAQLNTDWGTVQSGSGVISCSASNGDNEGAARWIGAGTFTDDQYAEITLGGLQVLNANFSIGVICRSSADANGARDFYFAQVQATDSGAGVYTSVLGKYVNGTRTELHSASTAWADGDEVSLEVEGTTLRLCKNGAALGGSFTQVDTSLTTGLPGIVANGSLPTGDDWVGGNLSADVAARRMALLGVG